MRLLILSQYFWPENFRINEMLSALVAKGLKIDVLTGKPNYPDGIIFDGYSLWGCAREEYEGATIHRVPLAPRGNGRAIRLALNYISFIFFGLVCGSWLLRGKKFDAIFVYAPSPILQAIPAIFLGWLKGSPVILWVQDLWPASLEATGHVKNKLVLKLVEHIVRFIYRRVDLLLVQSEAFIAPVSALAGGTPVIYYPNSVDDSFSVPAIDPLPEVEGLDDKFSILFAGNIGTAQAVEVIVEAADLLKENNNIHFVVIGNGSRRDWMLQQLKERKLTNIYLPGRFPIEMMPGFMQKASVLLVTLADEEIFRYTVPSKVQAYLAAGRPILACLNGEGARLVVAAGAGLAIPAQDGTALATAILQMYGYTQHERDVLGANGSTYFAEHFLHDMLIDRLILIIQSCIGNRNPKGKLE